MVDVQVAVGDHRAAPVPAPASEDVDAGDVEGVGGAHHGADVEIVGPVLHGDFEIVAPAGVQVGFDGRDRPVAVAVEHVAAVAFVEQGGVEADVIIGG